MHVCRSRGARSKRVEGIYRVARREERPALATSERLLLWHGTRVSNLLGILATGLTASPSHATITGRAFGDGLYFADVYDKSASYSHGSGDSELLLLCEVAMGKKLAVKEYSWGDQDKVVQQAEKYDSLHVVGKHTPEEAGGVVTREGYTVPLGKVSKTEFKTKKNTWYGSGLDYSEYIVKDEARVNVRFIVKLGKGSEGQAENMMNGDEDGSEDSGEDSDSESG